MFSSWNGHSHLANPEQMSYQAAVSRAAKDTRFCLLH